MPGERPEPALERVRIAREFLGTEELTGKNDLDPRVLRRLIPADLHPTYLPLFEAAANGKFQAWCGTFVQLVCAMAGTPITTSAKERYDGRQIARLERLTIRAGTYFGYQHRPMPGDVYFSTSRGGSDEGPGRHGGIVATVTRTEIVTIDGNWGNKVAKVRRDPFDGFVSGYARPGAGW